MVERYTGAYEANETQVNSNWIKIESVEEFHANTVIDSIIYNPMWRERTREILQLLNLIYEMTNDLDSCSGMEGSDLIWNVNQLYRSHVAEFVSGNVILKDVENVCTVLVNILGFYFNPKMLHFVKLPDFFRRENANQIQTFNKMIEETVHIILQKMFIEGPNSPEFCQFKRYKKRAFDDPELTLKERILYEMYGDMIQICSEDPFEGRGILNFIPGESVICAIIDDVHTVVYLGSCYRNLSDQNSELDTHQRKKKYGVVTAYFCDSPTMIEMERIRFQYSKVIKLGRNHYAVHWENRDISFERDMEEEWRSYSEKATDLNIPQHDPHPHEDYCLELADHNREYSVLFSEISEDMKEPYWRIFCRLPKTAQLFKREKELIQKYAQKFRKNTHIHFMIYGLSLLLGRHPNAIERYLAEEGLMEIFSTFIYEDFDMDTYNRKEEEELVAKRNQIRSYLKFLWSRNGKLWNKRFLELDDEDNMDLKKIRDVLNCKKDAWRNTINNTYAKKATILINRLINFTPDPESDIKNENGELLPPSMCKVKSEYFYKFDDISRGLSKYPVAAINTTDQIPFDNVQYVLKNKIFDEKIKKEYEQERINAKSNPIKCQCSYNRFLCHKNCECAGNKSAYKPMKRVLEQDYLVNQNLLIYECFDACGCSPSQCTNRLLQHGSQVKMQLFKTEHKGWGVKTLQKLQQGEFIAEYVGEIVSDDVAEERGCAYDKSCVVNYLFQLNPGDDSKYNIDALIYCNTTRWINHSCNPNMVARGVYVEYRHISMPRLGFFALEDIEAGEELTFDYAYQNIGGNIRDRKSVV